MTNAIGQIGYKNESERLEHEEWLARTRSQDPTVSALDALRQAVVAQTALLRSLSEQVRLGFEQEHHITMVAPSELLKGIEGQLAGLAERLDKQAEGRSVANSLTIGSLNAIEGRLAALEAKLSQSENDASADWMQARKLLELTNKRLKVIESRAHKPAQRKAKR